MPPSREAWASAFAAQSRSDWQVYDHLAAEPGIPACHQLHYLQMACEKIAKAYRCRDKSVNLEDLLKRHVGFAKFMGSFALAVIGCERNWLVLKAGSHLPQGG